MTTVTHIVPLFAPAIDGVGDYALKLGRALRSGQSINSRFVIADPIWEGSGEVDGFVVSGPTALEASRVLEVIENDNCVVLHYVGYGYHHKGVPNWLVESIEQWRLKNPAARLITIFHEIWSSGPPWRSVFYLAPRQRSLIARLLRASDHAFSNTFESTKKLNRIKRESTSFLPVSANIELAREPTPHPRGTALLQPLIFGQPWTRVNCVRRFDPLFRELRRQRQLGRVIVMGKEARLNPASEDVALLKQLVPPENIFVAGEKSATEAAEIMDEADCVLFPGRGRDLCKSSVAISGFVCGCPVVLKPESGQDTPAPLDWSHFVSTSLLDCDLAYIVEFQLRKWNLQRVVGQAREWFSQNATWTKLAATVAGQLKNEARNTASAAR
jgi:hypothetical protein